MTSTEHIYNVLAHQDGVALLPTDVGYALFAITAKGLQKLYRLKNRPLHKPCGLLGGLDAFNTIVKKPSQYQVRRLKHPIGLLAQVKNHALTEFQIPKYAVFNQKSIIFFNVGNLATQLAKYAFKRKRLIMATSANKAGYGNSFSFDIIHPDVVNNVDIAINAGSVKYQTFTPDGLAVGSTLLDIEEKKVVRQGASFDIIQQQARALQLI